MEKRALDRIVIGFTLMNGLAIVVLSPLCGHYFPHIATIGMLAIISAAIADFMITK